MKIAMNQTINFKEFNRQQLIRKFAMQFAYGHREILLNFAKLDTSSLLIGVIQHGVGPTFTLSSDWPTPRFRGLKRSNLWVYSKKAADELQVEGLQNVFAIGSPWLYSKILDGYSAKANPPKTKFLVFPRHYSFSYLSEVTPTGILEKIRHWKSIAGSEELEICLYWSDFLNPEWQRIAREEGVVLVCAGISQTVPMWSLANTRIDYYSNLRQIMDASTHCIFESFTSAMFYACDLGKKVGIFQTDSSLKEVNKGLTFQKENTWLLKNVPGIFDTFERSPALESMTHELLGYDDLLSPDRLAGILRFQIGIIPKRFS